MQTRPQENGLPATLIAENWIGGEARRAKGELFERRSSSNRDDLVTVAPISAAAEVREACEKARPAQQAWARTPAPQRAQVLTRLARLLVEQKEPLSRFVSREMGKPLREARGSVQEAIDTAEFFQSEGRRLYGQTVPSELNDKELFTYRRPIGVVGVVTAGNFPIAVPSWKIIPALLTGNAVVWKPSDDAPGTAAIFTDLWARAGLPPGVLSLVHGGGGGGAGEFLVDQVDAGLLDKVSFTGSTAVGRKIGEICGRNLQVPSLELGGKNPLVILADADLELAVEGALWASFGTAGQRCTSAGNIIVDRRVLPMVREQLVQRARSLKIGDPLDESVDYGPFINARFLEKWIAQRAIGLEDGAELLLDGKRVIPGEEPHGFSGDAKRGLYATPRIFDRVKMSMRIAQEECFGPTVNLVEVDGLDEAIAAANGTPYGLSSAIYTRDAKAMLRFKEEIRAGMTSVNNSTTGAEAHLPFGGNGWSGNGTRESGIWVIDAYTRWQAVNVDLAGKLQKAQIDLVDREPPEPLDWSALLSN
ncbi:MAG: aldehyde dehydrogenase family protein [Sorangiineae bacterium]|nr:aldehyde dehydrogenase family protein [Polyangiaceae bacterium]MEB2321750.1 aldehyde dehydrogenase family protein [Sorangiineae bacterium]